MCPGNSECRVFSAGTKIVVAKNLELKIPFGNVFEGFFNKVLRHLESYYCILDGLNVNASGVI
jgi:hypothetical protein